MRNSLSKRSLEMEGGGRNRSPKASFCLKITLFLPMSQAQHRHYKNQHLLTFADVFADSQSRAFREKILV